jgi:hypothetical protein
MQTTIDGGTIHFASMNRFNAPNYILNNYLYDIWGFEQKPDGKPIRRQGNGVYLDWATSHTTVKNNVIYNISGWEIRTIMGNWNLDIENNLVSKTRIEPLLSQEIGPKGTASQFIKPENLINAGGVILSSDNAFVQYSGSWEQATVTGHMGLFESNYSRAAPAKAARCEFRLPIKESGTYKICLMYFPNAKNASNAKITVKHSKGEDAVDWNFKKGDSLGFAVVVGEYYLDMDKPSSVIISNANADGFIVADGVGYIKVK